MRPRAVPLPLALTLVTLLSSPSLSATDEPSADAPTAELFAAARAGDLDSVRGLIEAGTPVDLTDRYGQTALSFAAGAGHASVVRWLLSQGADPNARESFYGSAPLQSALWGEHREAAIALLEAGAEGREEALAQAVQAGDVGLARAAVESGPILASALARWTSAEEVAPGVAAVLAAATSRPDPPPPDYTLEEIHAFTGIYEGWLSDTRVEVVLREGSLLGAIDGSDFERLVPRAEESFTTSTTGVELAFFGRAGTIEGIALQGGGRAGESLRRSVAEPIADGGVSPVWTGAATRGETLHWPAFRGANAAGVGDGADLPVRFDLESGEGVAWQAGVPGLGNSSPVIWGDRVFVTTAVAEEAVPGIETGLTGAGSGHRDAVPHSWRVLAFDKHSGRELWSTEVARRTPESGRHFKATQANSTPATDGRHLVAVFPTVGLVCLDLDGKVLWQHDLGTLSSGAFTDPGLEWGFASSPVIHGSRVILQVDVHAEQYLAAWDLASGEPVWRTEREVAPSWATPTLVSGPAGDELVVNGSTIHGYDPETGRELWSLGPNSELVIATPVAGDGVAYVAAGYPPIKPIYAVRLGLRGAHRLEPGDEHRELLWSQRLGGAYMPTPLLYRGLYYVVHHNGRLVAYDATTGAALYKQRFSQGGTFTASPVAANGRIYVPTEEGRLYVIESGPEYRELGVSQAGEPLMATPAISQDKLFLRTPSRLIALAGSEG